MSYLVLARKWRPQFFRDVIGQKHVTSTLQNALVEDRLAHALIFSGPRGVGKTSIARILAKAVNCEKGPAPEPCNQCNACQEITSGISVDVQEIDGASNRGIDEIRELRDSVKFRPVKCRFKIYVIDEVHMLTREAFNALLKTLEEPPPYVFFVFATTEPRKIPPTINSRCQHYEFHRMSAKLLASHLDMIVEAEGMGLSREATLILAQEAGGSVRDSLSLLDQVAAYGARDSEQVCEALGLAGEQVLADVSEAMLDGNTAKCLEIVHRIHGLGGDMQKFASNLVGFFRNLAVLVHVDGERGTVLSGMEPDSAEKMRLRFSEYPDEVVLQAFDAMIQGQEKVAHSTCPRASLELLLMRICAMKQAVSIDKLIEKIDVVASETVNDTILKNSSSTFIGTDSQENVKRTASSALKHAPHDSDAEKRAGYDVSSPSAMPSPDKCDAGFDISRWPEFITSLRQTDPLSASLLSECTVSEKGVAGKLGLACSGGAQYKVLSDRERLERLQDEFRTFFNAAAEFHVCYDELSKDNDSDSCVSGRVDNDLKHHPFVRKALDIFNARIVNVQTVSDGRKTAS